MPFSTQFLQGILRACTPFVTLLNIETDVGEKFTGYRYKKHDHEILVVVPVGTDEEYEINLPAIEHIELAQE